MARTLYFIRGVVFHFLGEGDSSKARTQHTIVFYFSRGWCYFSFIRERHMYDIFSYLGVVLFQNWCVGGGGGGEGGGVKDDYLGEA